MVGNVVRLHGESTRATAMRPLPGQVLPLRVRWHGSMRTESFVEEEDVQSVETAAALHLPPPLDSNATAHSALLPLCHQALMPRSP